MYGPSWASETPSSIWNTIPPSKPSRPAPPVVWVKSTDPITVPVTVRLIFTYIQKGLPATMVASPDVTPGVARISRPITVVGEAGFEGVGFEGVGVGGE